MAGSFLHVPCIVQHAAVIVVVTARSMAVDRVGVVFELLVVHGGSPDAGLVDCRTKRKRWHRTRDQEQACNGVKSVFKEIIKYRNTFLKI